MTRDQFVQTVAAELIAASPVKLSAKAAAARAERLVTNRPAPYDWGWAAAHVMAINAITPAPPAQPLPEPERAHRHPNDIHAAHLARILKP